MTTRVLICVPALDHCATDFAMSLGALMGHTTRDSLRREVSVSLWAQKGSIIMDARNAAVEAALTHNATHLLFLDSDMTFPPDTLARLLYRGEHIVGATYPKRVPPHDVLGRFVGVTYDEFKNESGVLKAYSMPFGVMLIKTAVFAKLPRPFFRYLTTELGTVSEDEWFCLQANEAGFDVYCDLALTREVGHVGQQIFRTPQ